MIWTLLVEVNYCLSMENVIWLAIISGIGSIVSALIGYDQLVKEANLPPWLKDMYYDVIPGIPGIMGNVGCLAPWC